MNAEFLYESTGDSYAVLKLTNMFKISLRPFFFYLTKEQLQF